MSEEFDDGLVTVNEALNHLQVLDVGPMEEIDNIVNEEGYHTHQYVAEALFRTASVKGILLMTFDEK